MLNSVDIFGKSTGRDQKSFAFCSVSTKIGILYQAAETVDIMDEIRTVYNAFLPLFPYCYAYWKRYSDLERKKENWQRSLAILHR